MTMRVIGDTAVIAKFEGLGAKINGEVVKSVARLALLLQRKVARDKLTGQVLKVRTGTLRRSIDQVLLRSPDAVRAVVSTNVSYARAHEYGFHGAESVQAHLRTIKQAWGRSITPKQVMVSAHTRQANIPERSFLRSSLREMAPEILAELEAAAARAAQ